ncbi:hypothetical protein JHW43_006795 [Diplocarpon mali]|nr:hypothetical protein JHW43_006795 [Diplocarpon mali]
MGETIPPPGRFFDDESDGRGGMSRNGNGTGMEKTVHLDGSLSGPKTRARFSAPAWESSIRGWSRLAWNINRVAGARCRDGSDATSQVQLGGNLVAVHGASRRVETRRLDSTAATIQPPPPETKGANGTSRDQTAQRVESIGARPYVMVIAMGRVLLLDLGVRGNHEGQEGQEGQHPSPSPENHATRERLISDPRRSSAGLWSGGEELYMYPSVDPIHVQSPPTAPHSAAAIAASHDAQRTATDDSTRKPNSWKIGDGLTRQRADDDQDDDQDDDSERLLNPHRQQQQAEEHQQW